MNVYSCVWCWNACNLLFIIMRQDDDWSDVCRHNLNAFGTMRTNTIQSFIHKTWHWSAQETLTKSLNWKQKKNWKSRQTSRCMLICVVIALELGKGSRTIKMKVYYAVIWTSPHRTVTDSCYSTDSNEWLKNETAIDNILIPLDCVRLVFECFWFTLLLLRATQNSKFEIAQCRVMLTRSSCEIFISQERHSTHAHDRRRHFNRKREIEF